MDILFSYLALLEMQATLCENLQVEIVSCILHSSVDMVAIIAVRQLPPMNKKKKIVFNLVQF